MFVVVDDTQEASLEAWEWQKGHHAEQELGFQRQFHPRPRPRSTPYRSVKWHLVRRHPGRILIRYHQRDCFTFDHVNVDGTPRGLFISVILSSGPNDRCPRPSATAPFAAINRAPGGYPLRHLHHQRTGPVTYLPESA